MVADKPIIALNKKFLLSNKSFGIQITNLANFVEKSLPDGLRRSKAVDQPIIEVKVLIYPKIGF